LKYLIVFAVLGILLTLLYLRLRPYINFARRVFGVVRESRGMGAGNTMASPAHQVARNSETLVRCAVCGAWVPASRALTFRSAATSYCSHACMERSAGGERAPQTASRTQ